MQCANCQYPRSEVVETRHDEKSGNVIRRRQCLRCGVRFSTREQIKLPRGHRDNQEVSKEERQ
jgi:transcriptional regulator NrdR family protein